MGAKNFSLAVVIGLMALNPVRLHSEPEAVSVTVGSGIGVEHSGVAPSLCVDIPLDSAGTGCEYATTTWTTRVSGSGTGRTCAASEAACRADVAANSAARRASCMVPHPNGIWSCGNVVFSKSCNPPSMTSICYADCSCTW